MFQSFEDFSDSKSSAARVALLRKKLESLNLEGFIIPHEDEFQSEYLPPCYERLSWISGFTGSAGTAIVTRDKAVIFVDGRYVLQVKDQIDASIFQSIDVMTQAPSEWIRENLPSGARLGYDPWLHTLQGFRTISSACEEAKAELVEVSDNLIDAIWDDQPPLPLKPVQIHGLDYAGKSSADKRKEIGEKLKEKDVDAAVIASPSSVAWLLNIRGQDVLHTPLVLCRAIYTIDGRVKLFVDLSQINIEVRTHLGEDVEIYAPNDFDKSLSLLGEEELRVRIDVNTTPAKIVHLLSEHGAHIVEGEDPCTLPKAVKNECEQIGTRAAHIRDGLALCRFLSWLSEHGPKGVITEIEAAQKLEVFRRQSNMLKDLSFDTISGAGPNGAVVHYRVTENTNRMLQPRELYLVDSGGQYLDGTTDVTRTCAIGEPTDEMCNRFTLVLKGHIALAMARFPKGTSGAQLDVLARQALWQSGLDFDHGTGHGVGSYLGVHEGPQGISKRSMAVLEPGMIVSNEPGYYKTGAYGIRIENLVLVKEAETFRDSFGAERPMLEFETLTLAPIDRTLIDKSLLNADEIQWLNDYHGRVYDSLKDELDEPDRDWLRSATFPI